jgi:hypothetical protein
MRRPVHGSSVHALGSDRQDLDQDLPQVHPGGNQGEVVRHVQSVLHSAFQSWSYFLKLFQNISFSPKGHSLASRSRNLVKILSHLCLK